MRKSTLFLIGLRKAWVKSRGFLSESQKRITKLANILIPLLLIVCVGMAIYDFGFQPFWSNDKVFNSWLAVLLDIIAIIMGVRLLLDFFVKKKLWSRVFTFAGWIFILLLVFYVLPEKAAVYSYGNRFLFLKMLLYTGITLTFITEASYLLRFAYNRSVNPGALFVISFALLILIGAFLLKLPNATYQRLSAMDALFTSTSAVCVTGLMVVDFAAQFTTLGKLVILVLVQAGALGIMTFAALLAYAVTGGSSIRSQLAFREMFSSQEVHNIMHFIYRVVFVTLFFELAGSFMIYVTVDAALFPRELDRIFFAVFHGVSAFCNAGISTLPEGLADPALKFNYSMQLVIALLVILGGMGFPIVFNLYRFIKIKSGNFVKTFTGKGSRQFIPRLINLNSRLALVVSIFLLLIGFFCFLAFEQSASLLQHPTWYGKLVTSFVGSVMPRTAGFNTVDLSTVSLPIIMIYILLMWVGASPGSTGGGIKTTTAGVAVLNLVSVLRGKDRTEFFRAEISHQSVRRAFAIILMSLLFIGVSIFLISINDADKGLFRIAFEVFAAFSTAGFTMDLTPQLSGTSKFVLMITMFVGRVGTITLLTIFIRQSKQLYYRYPKEEITF